jgi:DNA repair protein RadC
MKDSKKQIELKFEVGILPPPTVPPVSWEEARETYGRGPVVGDPQNAAEYFRKYIGGRAKEAFLTMYLDHRNHVLDVVLNNEGTVDHTAVYPREVLKKALDLNATGMILAHNHPAGSLEPSEGDKQLTRQISTAARALGLTIHDHLIVTHEGHFSFRQAGLV